MIKIPDSIKEISRKLRKDMTKSEKILWHEIQNRKLNNIKFVRQFPIYIYTENSGLDRYLIPDFLCREQKIIIEIDGSIHNLKKVYTLDKIKEDILIKLGYKILRFKNSQIENELEEILKTIASSFSG